MRITRIKATNLRQFPTVDWDVQEGLTVIRGPNSAGKTTLATIAPCWCIWGPTAIDDQDNLVRDGERDLSVEVEISLGNEVLKIWRRFLKHANRDGGIASLRTWLWNHNDWIETSHAKIVDTQQQINYLVGTYQMFATTAYVDQDDGPGAFMKLGGADKRSSLRDIVIADEGEWDRWHEDAQAQLKQADEDVATYDLQRMMALEHAAKLQPTYPPEGEQGEPIPGLEGELEEAEEANTEVKRQVAKAEWDEKISRDFLGALSDLSTSYDTAVTQKDQAEKLLNDAVDRSEVAQKQLNETEDILNWGDLIRGKYDAQNDVQDKWEAERDRIRGLNTTITAENEEARRDYGVRAKAVSDEVSRIQQAHSEREKKRKEAAKCEKCGQPIDVPDALAPTMPAPATLPKIKELHEIPDQPVRDRTIDQQYDALIKAKDEYLEVKEVMSKADKAVEDARAHFRSIEIPTPPDENELLEARTQQTVALQRLSEARQAAEVAQRALGTAEEAVRAAQAAQTEADALTQTIDSAREELAVLELVVEKLGPNGVRQLMLDQALRDLEVVCESITDKIMPGYRIVFGTESKTGRETLEDGVVTPTGFMKWRNFGGGHGAASAMAVRMGLIELLQRYQGVQYDHLILDEPDAAMRDEVEEEFIMLMGRIAETGKTVTMISHDAESFDIIGSHLILEPGPNGTTVRTA